MDPVQRLAQERFGRPAPEAEKPADEYVHTLLASPRGRDCVTYQDLGEAHVPRQECPCRPNLVHCGDERVWLHQRQEEDGVRIGDDL